MGKLKERIRLVVETCGERVAISSTLLLLLKQDMLKPLIDVALQISKLAEFTGRKEPNVIT